MIFLSPPVVAQNVCDTLWHRGSQKRILTGVSSCPKTNRKPRSSLTCSEKNEEKKDLLLNLPVTLNFARDPL